MPDSHRWTAEDDALARKMAAKGATASEVATAIGGGVSRCAVIGRMRRKGIPSLYAPTFAGREYRPKPRSRPAHQISQAKTAPPTPPPAQEPPPMVTPHPPAEPMDPPPPLPAWAAPPGFQPTSLHDLVENQCRWPVGDALFCGAPRQQGARHWLCPHHSALAYTRQIVQRRRAA